MQDLKQKTLSGFVFKLGERGAAQAVSFIVQIVLARILMPEEFGTIALLNVFMLVLNVFVTYGFGNSLVVNKDSDDLDFSTCFYFGVVLAILIYIAVFFLSPIISRFLYDRDDLSILIKVIALSLPVSAINSVQYAYIAKNMRFRLSFYATFIGTVLSGIVGMSMAYLEFGVWALVAQYLSNSVFGTVSLWLFSKWRPIWAFSFKRLKAIYDYGWKILAVGLVDTLFGQIQSLVIAKKYTRSDLAYYNRGSSFPGFGMAFVEPTISEVLFPALSNCNDDREMMKSVTRRVIKSSTFIVCGVMCLLAAMAKPLVVVLLTEKWLECVVFLQIGCVANLFRPLQVINSCVIRASGKSGLLLKLDLLKKGIGLALLFASMRFGVVAIAWSLVLTNFISLIINIYPNKKLLQYGYLEQIKDIVEIIIIGAIMTGLMLLLTFLPISNLAILLIQFISGIGVYCLIARICKEESYFYLKNIIIEMVNKLKKR